jgi:two-component system, chemotaxis family, protein-glutamate methylesterase/glutaminase
VIFLKVYNTIIIAANALSRKLIKNIVLNSKNANLQKIFSSLTTVDLFIQENNVQLVILDPLVMDKDYIELMATLASNYPKIKFLFPLDLSQNYPENMIETLTINRATFLYFSSDVNCKSEKIDSNLENVMERYDHILGCLLIGLWDQLKENTMNSNNESQNQDKKKLWKGADVVLIASSTGGPAALEVLFSGLRDKIQQPILMVQHMPEGFTNELCKDLEGISGRKTIEGYDGLEVVNGSVILAPGSYHMVVRKTNERKIIGLKVSELVNGVRPSADVLFHSVAKACPGKKVLVIVLTGMGIDGLRGVEELKKRCDCYCISQSERTSVVYGMPRAIFEAGLSDEILDIENIHTRIISLCKSEEKV